MLSDDPRLLRLVQRYADPAEGIGSVLAPVAAVFGSEVAEVAGVHRLDDAAGPPSPSPHPCRANANARANS